MFPRPGGVLLYSVTAFYSVMMFCFISWSCIALLHRVVLLCGDQFLRGVMLCVFVIVLCCCCVLYAAAFYVECSRIAILIAVVLMRPVALCCCAAVL